MTKQMTFTSPGKLGDCLMQFPVAYWWHRETGRSYDFWLDEKSCKPLEPLIRAQPGCNDVVLRDGIENWNCGGQPWHFNLKAEDHEDRQFCHFGFRAFPQRQLTLQTMTDTYLNLEVDQITLARTPCFVVPELPKANRLILHGTGICCHTRQTPKFWQFLARVRNELASEFEELVFVGSDEDREVARAIYPKWGEFDDGGDFLKLASYVNASRLMIACGSSMAALAGALKLPCVRVHDEIGGSPKVIWSNLGPHQLNATELELRTAWPEFKAELLAEEAKV